MKAKAKNQYHPDYRIPIGEFIREAFYVQREWNDYEEDNETIAIRQTCIVLEMLRLGFTQNEIAAIFLNVLPLKFELCEKISSLVMPYHSPQMISNLDALYYEEFK